MLITVKFLLLFVSLTLMISNLKAITIDCEYNNLSGWKTVSDANKPYGCILKTINVKTKTTVTKATGTHYYGNTDRYVRGLNIYGNVCKVIPNGFDTLFGDILYMSVWQSSLDTLSSRDLKQFPRLQELWIYHNPLEYIEPQLFAYNQNLQYIALHHNQIQIIGSNFFDELPELNICNLTANKCGITGEAGNANELKTIRRKAKKTCSHLFNFNEEDFSNNDYVYFIYILQYRISVYEKNFKCQAI